MYMALSLPSLLGLLLLIGIVVSNVILPVDFATKEETITMTLTRLSWPRNGLA